MTIKFSVLVRNGELDAIETVIGVSAVLKIRTGAPPALITDPDSGTVLATANLPVDWMLAAAAGVKNKNGNWEDLSADNNGIAAHFRIYANGGVTQHMQGTVTGTGGGGDMEVTDVNFILGGQFQVTLFRLTAGNA